MHHPVRLSGLGLLAALLQKPVTLANFPPRLGASYLLREVLQGGGEPVGPPMADTLWLHLARNWAALPEPQRQAVSQLVRTLAAESLARAAESEAAE